MPKKQIVQVNLAAANPNLSPATRFGDLVFVAGQTGRDPVTGEVGRDVREQTRYAIERIKMILETAGSSLDNVLTVLTHLTIFFQAEDGIRDGTVTGVQTCALPICMRGVSFERVGAVTLALVDEVVVVVEMLSEAARLGRQHHVRDEACALPSVRKHFRQQEIGRASCRERV